MTNRELAAPSPSDPDAAAEASEQLRADTYTGLATVAHLIKASGFRGENEVRVVASSLWSKGNVRYREGAYGIVGYMVLAASPGGRPSARVVHNGTPLDQLPVKSVRLGPLLRLENRATVEGLLRDFEYSSVAVDLSAVPLR